ncbi:hypothetical protein [Leucobacter sp. wl10]|uniref:hypothetical protein n=1 Tax=Leucobacter sp. wl10 TaxID=2304677 RepID=UPI000E5B9F67|nr:hypothetical protein [Leucobacter sp. wl10]RGE23167.1 hypothetical protein D1J51_02705 [Leucobacter sp. wl10]
MSRTPRIGIVSYCDHLRTYAHVNHEAYARRHGYTYIFDIAPVQTFKHNTKLEKIQKLLPLFDWLFWIDDDAFFTRPEMPLTEFLDVSRKTDFVFCESPVNDGKKTWLSSGNFFVRNTQLARQLLDDVAKDYRDERIRDWWDENDYGYYTHGDQDAFVFHFNTQPRYQRRDFVRRLSYEAFNTRPFHFEDSLDEHFLVHFTGDHKGRQAAEFAQRFDVSEALIPHQEFKRFRGVYAPREGEE